MQPRFERKLQPEIIFILSPWLNGNGCQKISLLFISHWNSTAASAASRSQTLQARHQRSARFWLLVPTFQLTVLSLKESCSSPQGNICPIAQSWRRGLGRPWKAQA